MYRIVLTDKPHVTVLYVHPWSDVVLADGASKYRVVWTAEGHPPSYVYWNPRMEDLVSLRMRVLTELFPEPLATELIRTSIIERIGVEPRLGF